MTSWNSRPCLEIIKPDVCQVNVSVRGLLQYSIKVGKSIPESKRPQTGAWIETCVTWMKRQMSGTHCKAQTWVEQPLDFFIFFPKITIIATIPVWNCCLLLFYFHPVDVFSMRPSATHSEAKQEECLWGWIRYKLSLGWLFSAIWINSFKLAGDVTEGLRVCKHDLSHKQKTF